MTNELSRISLPAHSVIFNQGDDGDSAYIIEKGRVLIYLVKDGEEIPLVVLGEGEIFGELSLIDLQRRSASARKIGRAHV